MAGNVNECTSWTDWKNWDSPSGTGDQEIPRCEKFKNDISSKCLPEKNCNPVGAQGRIKQTNQTVTFQNVQIDLDGLVCSHALQIGENCLDYEVRFCCKGKTNKLSKFGSNKVHQVFFNKYFVIKQVCSIKYFL